MAKTRKMKSDSKKRAIMWMNMRLSGMSRKEIAQQAQLSERTVETILIQLAEEYEAKDQIHLVGKLMAENMIGGISLTDSETLGKKYILVEARNSLHESIKTINESIQKIVNE